MFRKFIFASLFLAIFVSVYNKSAYAIYDPLSRPNNFFGIHILFPDELDKAKSLINSSGGDWGYVTIPIQVGDKDIEKWQDFMNRAYNFHIIPILRLATEADYKIKGVWRKPDESDILDFANFLSSIYWPAKNRYILLFNEVNRSDEWGGDTPSASEYANLIDYAVDVFKSKSPDFFLIMAGLDNAAPNEIGKFVNEYDFIRQMAQFKSTLFNRIDGFASHSYPNPNFSDAPSNNKRVGTASYRFEYDLIKNYLSSEKPIFITETGWNSKVLSDETVSTYYEYTFENIWGKDRDKIVAITPFILESQNGQFDTFSFLKNSTFTKFGKTVQSLKKEKGNPEINPAPPVIAVKRAILGIRDFRKSTISNVSFLSPPGLVKMYFRLILGI